MTNTENKITAYAMARGGCFTRRGLAGTLCSGKDAVSEKSLSVTLGRMAAGGKIARLAYGRYRLADGVKTGFVYMPDDFMIRLSNFLREKFPFACYCIWRPSVMAPLMRHVPAANMILLDVERIAAESVFWVLRNAKPGMPVLLAPSELECERYISNDEMIIVRPLVKEAPVEITNGCPVPALEKMLVDAAGDREIRYMQGNELFTIYTNAFDLYSVNRRRLLRYASRRNRKEKVERILTGAGK